MHDSPLHCLKDRHPPANPGVRVRRSRAGRCSPDGRVGLMSMTSALSPSSGLPGTRPAATAVGTAPEAAQASTGTLRGITVEWPAVPDTQGLLEYLVRDDVLCWVRREGGLAGFGEVARFTASGPDRFQRAAEWWRGLQTGADIDNQVGGPGTGPVAFGSFAFSYTSSHSSRLVVPEVLVGLDGDRAWLTYLTYDGDAQLSAATAEAALAAWMEEISVERSPDPADSLVPGQVSEQAYMDAVAAGVERIQAGKLSKLVVARDVVANLSTPIATAQVLRELAARYTDCWTYSVDGLIGSTPEMLVKVTGDTARARVLAGTLDRATAPTGDEDYAARMLSGSEKQRHEHRLAIDSLTAELGPLVTGMSAPEEPFVLELPNVWHLASDVEARLRVHDDGTSASALDL